MRRTDERNSLVSPTAATSVIDFQQPQGDENHEQAQESAADQAAVRVEVAAREKHEDHAKWHAFIGHIGVEHHARQREINDTSNDKKNRGQRMKLQNPVAHGPHPACGQDCDQCEGHDVGRSQKT